MALTRSEIQQQLVSLPPGLSDASAKFADGVWSNPRVCFAPSSVRGSTLISSQGDHATAYALYWEYMRAATAAHTSDGELHVSPFSTEVNYRLQQDSQALEACSLIVGTEVLLGMVEELKEKIKKETASKAREPAYKEEPTIKIDEMIEYCQQMLVNYKRRGDEQKYNELNIELRRLVLKKKLLDHLKTWEDTFKAVLSGNDALQIKYDEQISKLHERHSVQKGILESAFVLKETLDPGKSTGNEVIAANITSLLDKIQQLEKFIVDIPKEERRLKAEYFCTVIRKWAENFLLYQNQMPFVTFQRIPDLEASADEGIRVSAALTCLRKLNDSGEKVQEKDLASILAHIITLLFLPKIDQGTLMELEKQKQEILGNNRKNILQHIFIRDNDLNVFSYIIARHLHTVFNAFPILFEQPGLKEKIQEEFIKNMLDGWELEKAEKKHCEKMIGKVLAIYTAPPSSQLDLSLTDMSFSPIRRTAAPFVRLPLSTSPSAWNSGDYSPPISPILAPLRQKEQEEAAKLTAIVVAPASKSDSAPESKELAPSTLPKKK